MGPAADIYSLGVIIYEALTGRLPFTANNTDDYHREHCFALVPDLGDGFSSDLDRVLHKALAKEPCRRHANVLELATDLRAVLHADPHEQIRSLTRRWQERGRRSDMLARGTTLKELKRSVQRPRVVAGLSDLENSFIAMSMRRARRVRWSLGALVALAAMSVLLVRAEVRARIADQLATASEVEQGRQALLHGEPGEALRHLEQAYQRGERSPGTKFMLARALQPRMSEIARFSADTGRMWSAAFAPDGKRVLTTDDKSAQMWDAASGRRLFTMNHGDTMYAATFSPDGSRIVTAGGDGTVRIWNATTGAPIRELRYQSTGAKQWRYAAVAISQNLVAATDTMGRAVHIWNAETGAQVADLANDGPGAYLVAFSTDGHWLASSGREEARVFDTSSWQQVATIVGARVRSLAFDPTGPRVAVGTHDGVASIWEIPSGVRLRSLRDAGAPVDAVAFARDGELVATASRGLWLRSMTSWPLGIYEGPPLLWTRLVVVNELPVTRDTLLVRLLGAGSVLKQAIAELKALPADAPERTLALPILHDEPTLRAWLRLVGTAAATEVAAAIRASRAS